MRKVSLFLICFFSLFNFMYAKNADEKIEEGNGLLYFTLVNEEKSEELDQLIRDKHILASGNVSEDFKNEDLSFIPDNCEILGSYNLIDGEEKFGKYEVVEKKASIKISHVQNVSLYEIYYGLSGINVDLTEEGAKIFYNLTASNMNRRLAIVFNRKIKIAPIIKAAISGGKVCITGLTIAEANILIEHFK